MPVENNMTRKVYYVYFETLNMDSNDLKLFAGE